MATYQSPLTVIIKGAIAGAAGTAAMGAAMDQAPKLLEGFGLRMPLAPAPPTAPDEQEAKATAGQAIHWTYGSAWGAYYAVIQSSLKPPPLLHGIVFGALVGGVASTLIPRLGLQNPPSRNPPQINAMYLAAHVVYGVSTAVAYAILNLGRRG